MARPGSSKGPMTDIQTTRLLVQLFYQCFYYYHYHHRYQYLYHHFIINILCYAYRSLHVL